MRQLRPSRGISEFVANRRIGTTKGVQLEPRQGAQLRLVFLAQSGPADLHPTVDVAPSSRGGGTADIVEQTRRRIQKQR